MKLIRNLSVRYKLLLLVAVPLLLTLYLEVSNQTNALRQINGLESVQLLVEVSAENSLLAHELQKERGMSAGYLGSQGRAFGDKLPAQRKLTDERWQAWQSLVSSRIRYHVRQ